ncbi:MAG: protein-glutamate O-methyltransferase CheR [Cryomorphaceae bacterium]|jgi:chemotaxis protein methyltransferase CheR|nr:protein-glutamate O-methyltransferase CheR [Cryomorphaceae bacterium]
MEVNFSAYQSELSDKDFDRLSQFIYTYYGIKLPLNKKIMLQSRLKARLKENGIATFKEYCDFVLSGKGGENEIIHMIDVVSTNKTDFYREAIHFDFMKQVALPEMILRHGIQHLKVWSSACSSGEEPYTLTFVLSEFREQNPQFDFSILGTDISTRILEKARTAIYPTDRVDVVPLAEKKKYLLRSKDQENPMIRIIPELRAKTRYARLNLIDDVYTGIPKDFDLLFCRNVLIYFDRPTQEKVINKLCTHLKTGGYFFLGHSESISAMDVPLKQIKPTIFQKI